MKKYIISILSIAVLAFASCSPSDITIQNFDSDNFGDWTVEGDAFGTSPVSGALPGGQQEVTGFEGKSFANSFHGGDDSQGTLISPEFIIERDYINFLLAGGNRQDMYIQLSVEGEIIYTTRPIVESEIFNQMTWDVKKHSGKKAVIKIVDNQRGDWGHILADQIEMSNTEKSNIIVNHIQSYKIENKYLLLPVEKGGPETKVYIQKDGKTISPLYYIRIAQSKIDYWVPIDVEKYKGEEISLFFDHVKKTDTGFSQISQSDDFDFDYKEKYRPDYHFSPRYGWTNDPNGMVYVNGEYHLYYQHNPYGTMWGNMHWGHAVSKDLKRWEHLPVAIAPDTLGTIFSGSAVIDKDNTAGFGKGALVAIYTSEGKTQTQCIAYSHDNGRTFTKYENNPVLTDPNYRDFRDPKVFWHAATRQWIMSLATTQVITFYGSKNLKEWTKLSEFGEGIGNHGGVWECPDLFPLQYNGQTKWVLFVSINPGGPNKGSATQYFIGSFDGRTFKADNLPYPLWLDYGRDNYAGVTWDNTPDKRRIFIGWMSNWDYANQVPSINFSNAMTIPREISMANNGKHLIVANTPIKEIMDLRADTRTIENAVTENPYIIDKLIENNNGAYEIELTVKTNDTEGFELKLHNRTGENLTYSFNIASESLTVDRTKSGLVSFSDNFADPLIKSPLVKKNQYKLRLLMDKASSELFVNDGELVQTNVIFPTEPYNSLELNPKGGKVEIQDIKIHTLK